MAQSDKPRLFRKTVRAVDPVAGPNAQSKKSESPNLTSLGIHPSLAKFAFSSKLKGRIKRVPANESRSKPASREASTTLHPKPAVLAGRRLRLVSPLRTQKSHSALNFSVTPSLPVSSSQSLHASASPSPRSSYLTIDAINLELRLTSLLSESETLGSPQRQREAFRAYMDVLSDLSDRDPVFGPLLKTVKGEIDTLLADCKVREVSELEERNSDLKRFIKEQKSVIKAEADERAAQERVVETLSRERNLLWKKMEELQTHVRRAASRQGNLSEELEAKSRKVEELEEQLRIARKREARLLRLLEVIKDAGSSDSERIEERFPGSVVPPLDLLLLKKDPLSRLPTKCLPPLTSERSTEDLKSSLSLDLSDAASCHQ